MVKGFGLPENTAWTLKKTISIAGTHAFDSTSNAFERQTRFDQEMDVIRHHNVRKDGVLAQRTRAPEDARLDAFGYVRILEPLRPETCLIKKLFC